MRIGLDLDNTIICYDALFHRVARMSGLIPASVAASKGAVKAWVSARHGNDVWTELQAEVYGPRLQDACAYPGALDFVLRCRASGHSFFILSHKTQFPARGVQRDLRLAATRWLEESRWIGPGAIAPKDVEFHSTRGDKVRAIAARQCDVFVDDLPEVFTEPGFPSTTRPILFDPDSLYIDSFGASRAESWEAVARYVLGTENGGTRES
jgi:hypothetical protein